MRTTKNNTELSHQLKRKAKEEGFNPVGIAVIPGSERIALRTKALERWLEAGHHADMQWMHAPRRQKIESLLEGVNSVLSVGLNYYVKANKKPDVLNIGRYAWGRDYHKVANKRLRRIGHWLERQRPNCRWKICVDSDPLLEKAWAEEAGLGWIGKNSNLINQKAGSWFTLAHLLCTEYLIPDKPGIALCGKCQECINACPTKAITEPFIVNSQKCIAYHTIENRNETLPKAITSNIGKWVAGCDICQEVCPWNHQDLTYNEDLEIQPRNWILNLTKQDALTWNDQKWADQLRGSALKRIKPWMWRRNINAIQTDNYS